MNQIKNDALINKNALLDWLYSMPRNISVHELSNWIELKTNGKYKIIQAANKRDIP
jgi:hypothetical protein